MTGKEVPQYDAESIRALVDEMAATYGLVNGIVIQLDDTREQEIHSP